MRHGELEHGYVPAFDGFRTICIAGVVLLHVGPTTARWLEILRSRGGFGVDAFFVLSGFLITSILFRELERGGTINVPRFYLRRALRLQPAYLSAMALMLLNSYLLEPEFFPTMLAAWPYLATYTLNLAVAFATIVAPAHVMVSWSLCIEEQFYFLWPWVLRGVGERRVLRFLMWALATVQIYRVATYLWLTQGHLNPPNVPTVYRVIFGTDLRIDTILYGCILAVAIRTNRPAGLWAFLKRSSAFPTLAVAGAALTAFWLNDPLVFWRFGLTGPALAGVTFAAVIAALVLQPQSWPSRALSWKPLVFIGKLSYGVYLFHMLVWSLLTHVLHAPYGTYASLTKEVFQIVTVFSGSVLIAWIHHRLIEARAMAWRETIGFTASSRPATKVESDTAAEQEPVRVAETV